MALKHLRAAAIDILTCGLSAQERHIQLGCPKGSAFLGISLADAEAYQEVQDLRYLEMAGREMAQALDESFGRKDSRACRDFMSLAILGVVATREDLDATLTTCVGDDVLEHVAQGLEELDCQVESLTLFQRTFMVRGLQNYTFGS